MQSKWDEETCQCDKECSAFLSNHKTKFMYQKPLATSWVKSVYEYCHYAFEMKVFVVAVYQKQNNLNVVVTHDPKRQNPFNEDPRQSQVSLKGLFL